MSLYSQKEHRGPVTFPESRTSEKPVRGRFQILLTCLQSTQHPKPVRIWLIRASAMQLAQKWDNVPLTVCQHLEGDGRSARLSECVCLRPGPRQKSDVNGADSPEEKVVTSQSLQKLFLLKCQRHAIAFGIMYSHSCE